MSAAVCLGCGRPLTGMRSDALYCTPACRRAATRYGGADGPRLARTAETFWGRYSRLTARHRPHRDDKGEGR